MNSTKLDKKNMNKFLFVALLVLFLSGCGEPKKINMADYGFKEEGTLFVRKVDAISALDDRYVSFRVGTRRDGYDYSSTNMCINFEYDGQKKEFCSQRFHKKKQIGFFGDVLYEEDDEEHPNIENIENMKRLEKRLHEVAGNHSVFDSLSELISKFK